MLNFMEIISEALELVYGDRMTDAWTANRYKAAKL